MNHMLLGLIQYDLPRRGAVDLWIPIVWCVVLCWMFVPGVALGADRFLSAIEIITSKEYKIVRKVDGQLREFHLNVWNATVANLTVMALGSAAPEVAPPLQ